MEFADYREYQLGDDIRRIDWNLYSRFEKHYLKLFTDERQMQVQVFLDCSASMGKDNPKKGSYAVATAAALGYLAVHNMDKVSFHLIKGDRSENPFGTIIGKNAFFPCNKHDRRDGFRRRGGHRERNSELSGDRNEQRTVCNNLGLFHGKRLEEGGGLPVLQKASGAVGAGAVAGGKQTRRTTEE